MTVIQIVLIMSNNLHIWTFLNILKNPLLLSSQRYIFMASNNLF